MNKKLTISIEKNLLEKVKKYATERNISISKLIENYLVRLTNEDNEKDVKITPLVKSLSGVLKLDGQVDQK